MTTNGGGWPHLDFAANRVLLANGHAVRCFGGLSANASSVTCLEPFFDDARAMPLYHYYCDGTDDSAKYILDWMAPLIGHRASTTLGFTGYSQQYVESDSDDNEYCYINGEIVHWSDARCAAYNAPGNGSCAPGRFTLNLAP